MIPKSINKAEISNWLKQNAKEQFPDTRREYYDESQVIEMKDTSHKLGVEINQIQTLKSEINTLLVKGNDNEINLDIPETKGIKALAEERVALDTIISKGYETIETTVYGIPAEDGFMYYYDSTGAEDKDRKRKLSSKENAEYNGMFATSEFTISKAQ